MTYRADPARYDTMQYRHSGKSGLKLPVISLGLWQNFGGTRDYPSAMEMLGYAFDAGVTHFDLANNYGPPPGSAEETFGTLLRTDLKPYRDELIVSSKAGYPMWPGPYGDWGSRKYLIASADQSLKRLGLDYVDIFYHHRPDPETPLEETMAALAHIVSSGRALYVGLSNYPADLLRRAVTMLRDLGTPCVIHQPRYSLLDRRIEPVLLPALAEEGIGCIAFSPLAQGILTDRYLTGSIPEDSRAARAAFLKPEHLTPERLDAVRRLNDIAQARGLTLARLALAWVLRHETMSSVLIGASRPSQILDAVAATQAVPLDAEALAEIDRIVAPLQP
jgi:L-glyceraldehyde 3-phosphate reductase